MLHTLINRSLCYISWRTHEGYGGVNINQSEIMFNTKDQVHGSVHIAEQIQGVF